MGVWAGPCCCGTSARCLRCSHVGRFPTVLLPHSIMLQAEEEEGGKVPVPPPPTDTPAGDLALAAKQLDSDQAAAGPGAFHAQAEQSAEQQPEDEQQAAAEQAEQPAEGEAEGQQQQKKRPRIVAT